MAAAAIKKKIDMVVMGVIFSHYFLILMDRAYGWVMPVGCRMRCVEPGQCFAGPVSDKGCP